MTQRYGHRRAAFLGALLITTAITATVAANPAMAQSRDASARSFKIAAQPLREALLIFGQQSGLQVTVQGGLAEGRTSTAISGSLSPAEALNRMLAGTGLTFRMDGRDAVRLERAPRTSSADGAIQLGAVRVEGATGGIGARAGDHGNAAGWDGTAGSIYATPGSVSVITRETLETYPVQAPADMLRGATGIISGEARTSGGLDINIRGMQGQGRVPVTVDGAINGTTVYRGYQGTSNRSFVDPDFISHIAIEKGPSNGNAIAGGIGGSVSMKTVSADDIIPEGETAGLRFRLSLSNNSTEPGSNAQRNLLPGDFGYGLPYAALRHRERPAMFQPTGGSGSLIFAKKTDIFDIVAGYSFRNTGNYHAGKTGKNAPKASSSPVAGVCMPNHIGGIGSSNQYACDNAVAYYGDNGLTAFVGGEEVLNTSNRTESVLVKATIRPADDHSIELGYGGYWSVFGENYPGQTSGKGGILNQKRPLSRTNLDRFTARYRWNPEADAIDLKLNGWLSKMEETAPSFNMTDYSRRFANSWGVDISNSSRIGTALGLFSADYGASYMREEAGPVGNWNTGFNPPSREGVRREYSLFGQASLEPAPWLRLDGGMRYQSYRLRDNQSGTHYSVLLNRSEDAFGYSLGAAVTPVDGLQLFATYKEGARLPSLMEATVGFNMIANPDLHKEKTKNWEFGANYLHTGLFSDDDELGLKLVWFDNDAKDYIARRYVLQRASMQMYNIDRAKFRGLEGNISYKTGGFSMDAGATYYDKVLFCRPDEDCIASSLASDYATNYIPPRWSANLHISQKLFDDQVKLGARVTYIGERSITAEKPLTGFMPLISAIEWRPYALVDLSASMKVSKALALDLSVDNVTDRHYVEAMSLAPLPAPGRTIRLGLTGQIGSKDGAWPLNWFNRSANANPVDWTGPYIGAQFGYGFGQSKGSVTDSAGNPADLDNGSRVDLDLNNVLGGAHAGFNYQLPGSNIVVGVEGDISTGKLADWTDALVKDLSSNTLSMRNDGIKESYTNYTWDRLMTLRGRLGYSLGETLVYGTGGVAWLRETQKRTQFRSGTANTAQGVSRNVDEAFTEQTSQTRTGWTAGAGVERNIGRNWSFRVEYSYAKFGNEDFHLAQAREGIALAYAGRFNPVDPVTYQTLRDANNRVIREYMEGPGTYANVTGRRTNSDGDIHNIRIGISYRF